MLWLTVSYFLPKAYSGCDIVKAYPLQVFHQYVSQISQISQIYTVEC
jgi:hypothetical protein